MLGTPKRVLVTSALPYAEGKPHLGNLFTIVAADVAKKFYEILGSETLFVTGSDEHGSPIALKAELSKISPKEFVDKNYREIIRQMELLGIKPDSFIRTSSELNKKLTQEIFKKLLERGLIEIKKTYSYYDPVLKRYLADRYVKGECPYCGAKDQYSDHCEVCGRYLKFGEIKNPYSVLSGAPVEIREVTHAFFVIRKIKDQLRDYIEHRLELEPGLKKYVLELLEKIDEWDITRNMSWGTPVPLPGFEDQVFYVWFDAPVGYLSAVLALGEDVFDKFWKDPDTYIVHVIGKDIVYHHAIFWLAMLMGAGEFTLPRQIYAHGYLTLEGQKLSKSRNWVVYAEDFVEGANIPGEYVRFYLATLHVGKVKDGDINLDDFAARINNELIADYVNLAYRVLKLVESRLQGRLPEDLEPEKDLTAKFVEALEKYVSLMREFNFFEAHRLLSSLAHELNRYLNETAPWSSEHPERALYSAAVATAWLSILYYPLVPGIAQRILELLGIPRDELKLENVGKKLKFQGTVRAERIASKVSEDQIKKLRKILESRAKGAMKSSEAQELYDVQEFLKFNIVVGQIKEVEELGKKLYKLKVDVGNKEITIVSGIRPYYSKEELLGKKIIVITNLKPKKFLGVESQGMLLAAEKDGKVSLLTVDKDIEPGARVR